MSAVIFSPQKERQTGLIREKDEQIDGLEKTIEDLQRKVKMLEADLENAEDDVESKTKYVQCTVLAT